MAIEGANIYQQLQTNNMITGFCVYAAFAGLVSFGAWKANKFNPSLTDTIVALCINGIFGAVIFPMLIGKYLS